MPITDFVAAVSVGIIKSGEVLDLCYKEDSSAIADMNVVMTESGEFIEVQATGEQAPFKREQLDKLMDLAQKGVHELIKIQRDVLGPLANEVGGVTKDEKVYSSNQE